MNNPGPRFPKDHPSIHCLPCTGEGKREGEREINFYFNNIFIYWFNSHTEYCACTDVNKYKSIVKLLRHKQIGGQKPGFKTNKQTKKTLKFYYSVIYQRKCIFKAYQDIFRSRTATE